VLSKNERPPASRTLDDLTRRSDQIRRRTADRDALLARLHAEGHSIPELARAAGCSVGKAHRLATTQLRVIGTIGYEGRDIDQFLEKLAAHEISIVVDVREMPLSLKRGFSKTALSSALADSDVGYLHLRGLGNPKDNRDGFRSGLPSAIQRFEERLSNEGAVDLRALESTISNDRVALLCFERDHQTCHRSCISAALQAADPMLHVVNL
jgi:hypothetical protein